MAEQCKAELKEQIIQVEAAITVLENLSTKLRAEAEKATKDADAAKLYQAILKLELGDL